MNKKTLLLLIHVTLQWVCFASQTEEFVRIQHQRMSNHVFTEFVARSAIECSSKCFKTANCRAVNFNPSSRYCQLCNETPLTSGVTLETNAAWNLYHIQASCESPWVYFDNSCYWMETTRGNWDYSYNYCRDLGADLLEISSSQENVFVASAASAAGLSSVWLTLNDKAVEGTYEWVSGEAVFFMEWGSNEGGSSNDEDCVFMIAGTGTWHDVHCARTEGFVCEKHID